MYVGQGSDNKDKLLIDKVEENDLYFDIYKTKCILCLSYVTLTMGDSLPAACHDAVTQLNDFGNADYLLGVVSLIGQQHQEEKYVGNDGLRIPAKTQDGLFLLKYVLNFIL